MSVSPRNVQRRASPRARRGSSQDSPDALSTYRKKRDFERTPEPEPSGKRRVRSGSELQFVVQKHDATRLHYDVRIEVAGAMMSWAVPKGPSYDPSVKRLAVETEDHPMEYNRFEGRIPDGGYGAGEVLIWDRGTYQTVPAGAQEAMRAKGHIKVRFFGEKLKGEWHFVRIGDRRKHADETKSTWLMFKAKDDAADPTLDIVAARPESVVSGKSATRGPRRPVRSHATSSPADLLDRVGSPMRATTTPITDSPDGFAYEVKLDGYRLLAALAKEHVQLATRKGNDWTKRFDPVARAILALPAREAVLDGEACLVDERGLSSFQMLQSWLGGEKQPGALVYAAFDLLWLDGRDLRQKPIEERRQLLDTLLKDAPHPLVYSQTLSGSPAKILDTARRGGVEGLIAKRKGSAYAASDTTAWRKIKFRKEQEVAIAGYIPRADAVAEVGALLISVVGPNGGLEYGGRVGTGFDRTTRRRLFKLLADANGGHESVAGAPRLPRARWMTPKLVAQITLAEWTRDGLVRAGAFVALRDDKAPAECVREGAIVKKASEPRTSKPVRAPTDGMTPAGRSRERAVEPPALANPTKVLYPRDGITKADISAYYVGVADVMLPHLAGRPIGLQRWPNGIDEKAWFQQHAPEQVPDYVRVLDTGEEGSARKLIVENEETLRWLANLAAITIHQWGSHVPPAARASADRALSQPDYAVIDLDPGDGGWEDVILVAQRVRHHLETRDIVSCVKTSGQRGLHILVPFTRGPTHEAATAFAQSVATTVAEALPEVATVERMKAKRGGRLYIDYLQNGHGKTIVAPYSLRAKDGAPVSTPVEWSEVTRKLDPSGFTLRTVLRRISKTGDLLASLLSPTQRLPAVPPTRSHERRGRR